ncbi:chemotaxis protein CheX [Quadrisphaera sp. DSM 44207]|uniref:chemotaxis protein CheX n=1 Tax=Quadrisphaera sp. DSM 44207 TaxID=1881057 RepID=UPI000885C658|nr:chemotaxis protein CheX [Quadrisphaera sp. DSM 44207]SDQ20552.1 Chemotaxis phosphatase CheX [Quadrisphaera sp. DSM 44207]
MSTPVHDVVDPEVVLAITDEVWQALLGEDEVLAMIGVPLPERTLSAWVGITGPWSGTVVLTVGAGTAEELTRCLLLRHTPLPPVVEAEDVEDGLGELANVVGGGIKGTLPGPSVLSLPEVGPVPPAGAPVCRVDALWRGQPVSIAVIDHVQDPATGAEPHDAKKSGVSL